MSDTDPKRPAPAKPVSLHPMGEEEGVQRVLRVPPPPKSKTVAQPAKREAEER